MTKETLTKEQMICDYYAMHFEIGEWCRHLIIDKKMTVEEVLEATQRLVDHAQRK